VLLASGLAAAATPARAQVPAGVDPRLFVIGDSVLLGARDAIVGRMAGWQVNVYAQEGLSTLGAASIVSASRASIGEIVVVALGNNDMGNPTTFGQRVDAVMGAIGPVRRVIWVNLRNFASWTPAMNQQLTLATSRWPNLVIADWSARATPDPSLVYGDGLHLTPGGQAAMAELVAAQVNAYVQQRVPTTTTTTAPPPTTTPRHAVPPPQHHHPPPSKGSRPAEPAGVPAALAGTGAGALVVFAVAVEMARRRRRAGRAPRRGAAGVSRAGAWR
jgi:lysophospholipase L1-like esterase